MNGQGLVVGLDAAAAARAAPSPAGARARRRVLAASAAFLAGAGGAAVAAAALAASGGLGRRRRGAPSWRAFSAAFVAVRGRRLGRSLLGRLLGVAHRPAAQRAPHRASAP